MQMTCSPVAFDEVTCILITFNDDEDSDDDDK